MRALLLSFYGFVRHHGLANRIISITLFSSIFGVSFAFADGGVTAAVFQSTDSYWGYGAGAASGYGFSEYLNSKAWKARVDMTDKEIARLKVVEEKHNALRDDALREQMHDHLSGGR